MQILQDARTQFGVDLQANLAHKMRTYGAIILEYMKMRMYAMDFEVQVWQSLFFLWNGFHEISVKCGRQFM